MNFKFLDYLDEGIIIVDNEGVIKDFNKSAVRLLQTPIAVGKKIFEFHTNSNKKQVEELFNDLKVSKLYSMSIKFALKDNILSFNFKRMGSEENFEGVLVEVKDITLQEKMEEQLREYTKNLEKLILERTRELESLNHIMMVVISSLELKDIILTFIQETKQLIDFHRISIALPIKEADKDMFRIFISSTSTPDRIRIINKFPASEDTVSGWVIKHGQSLIVSNFRKEIFRFPRSKVFLQENMYSTLASPLIFHNEVVGVVSLWHREIEAFKEKEKNILEKIAIPLAVAVNNAQMYWRERQLVKKLTETNQLKDAFLAIASHDLKSPLSLIIGLTEVLLARMEGPLTERQNTLLSKIHRNAKNMSELIEDFLDFSSLEAGELQLNYSKCNFVEIINEVISNFLEDIQQKRLTVKLDLPSEPVLIWVDAKRFKQIFTNLISNAIKYNNDGGWIKIKADCRPEEIRISVQDSGIGISKEEQNKVFSPYKRLVTARRIEGTGLGLYIVKHLVELHGGKIWLLSNVGEGTTFNFIIPLAVDVPTALP